MKSPFLKNLSYDLDNELGLIQSRVETLTDVEVLLGHLVDDMRMAVMNSEEMTYYKQHHREIRTLAELMFYSMKDLNKHYDKAQKIHQSMFQSIVKEPEIEKSLIAGNDKASTKQNT